MKEKMAIWALLALIHPPLHLLTRHLANPRPRVLDHSQAQSHVLLQPQLKLQRLLLSSTRFYHLHCSHLFQLCYLVHPLQL